MTLNSSASACPATQTICPVGIDNNGMQSLALPRSIFASTKKSCSFLRPLQSQGPKGVPGTAVPHRPAAPPAGPLRPPPRRLARHSGQSSAAALAGQHSLHLGRNGAGRLGHLTLGPAPRGDTEIGEPVCGFSRASALLVKTSTAAATVHAVARQIELALLI